MLSKKPGPSAHWVGCTRHCSDASRRGEERTQPATCRQGSRRRQQLLRPKPKTPPHPLEAPATLKHAARRAAAGVLASRKDDRQQCSSAGPLARAQRPGPDASRRGSHNTRTRRALLSDGVPLPAGALVGRSFPHPAPRARASVDLRITSRNARLRFVEPLTGGKRQTSARRAQRASPA